MHQAPDRVQVGQRRQRFGHIIAVEGQRQGLAHPFIVEGLLVHIECDPKIADGPGCGHHHLIAHLRLDGFHFTRGQKAQFHIDAARADGLGAGPIVLDDEILDPIHVGEPFFPIVGVALQLDDGAPHVVFQLEGPGADGMGFIVVDVLIEIFFGIDEVGRMGQPRQERRRRVVQTEDHGMSDPGPRCF